MVGVGRGGEGGKHPESRATFAKVLGVPLPEAEKKPVDELLDL